MSYTEKLISAIISTKPDSIPNHVIKQAKTYVLDTIGCLIGGYATAPGKQIAEQAKQVSGAGEATLFCDGKKISAPFACWANSSIANVLDMDDVFAGTAHQANCLIPTALAMGEVQDSTGLQVLHAIVLGFEVGARIMMYSWPSPSKAGTYYPSVWQVFNAVTVAGTLLGLKENEFYHAFGLAGTVPPIPVNMQKFVERPIGFSKNVFGWTTFTGVFWTLMAARGAEGAAHIFDGEAGFWKMMGSDYVKADELTAKFGEKYHILDTKFKPYPFCTWGHTTLDAISRIFLEHRIRPETIKAVKVRTLKRAVDFLSNSVLSSPYDAQFSIPHAFSMLALGIKPGPEWMSEQNMHQNAEAKSLAQKVMMEIDPLAEQVFDAERGLAIPSEVEIETVDGRAYKKAIKYSKGTPNNPFTEQEFKYKFTTLAASVFSPQRIQKIVEGVESLDKCERIREFTGLLEPET